MGNQQTEPMQEWQKRITVNSEPCGGRPCVGGLRIRVSNVLDVLAAALSSDDILEELPDLEKEDILAVRNDASRKLSHPVSAA